MASHLSVEFRRADASEIDDLLAIDEDAGALFTEAGFVFDSPHLPAYVAVERVRWTTCAQAGRVELALDPAGAPLGFIALAFVDARPYVEQLSVRRSCMQRGVGRALLARAIA